MVLNILKLNNKHIYNITLNNNMFLILKFPKFLYIIA